MKIDSVNFFNYIEDALSDLKFHRKSVEDDVLNNRSSAVSYAKQESDYEYLQRFLFYHGFHFFDIDRLLVSYENVEDWSGDYIKRIVYSTLKADQIKRLEARFEN